MPDEPSKRPYRRLPSDDEVVAALLAHNYVAADTARHFGVSATAVTKRLEAIFVRTGVDHRLDGAIAAARRRALIDALKRNPGGLLERLDALEDRVAALEARPLAVRIVEFKPNHRRVKDGGLNVNEQKRQLRRELGA